MDKSLKNNYQLDSSDMERAGVRTGGRGESSRSALLNLIEIRLSLTLNSLDSSVDEQEKNRVNETPHLHCAAAALAPGRTPASRTPHCALLAVRAAGMRQPALSTRFPSEPCAPPTTPQRRRIRDIERTIRRESPWTHFLQKSNPHHARTPFQCSVASALPEPAKTQLRGKPHYER